MAWWQYYEFWHGRTPGGYLAEMRLLRWDDPLEGVRWRVEWGTPGRTDDTEYIGTDEAAARAFVAAKQAELAGAIAGGVEWAPAPLPPTPRSMS